MTEQQRKGIEILNDLKANRYDDGTPVISDDDYFFLLSFIIDKPQEPSFPASYSVLNYEPAPLYKKCERLFQRHHKRTKRLSRKRI